MLPVSLQKTPSIDRAPDNMKAAIWYGNGGIVHVLWSVGVRIEDQDAREVITRVHGLTLRKLLPMLVGLRGIASISPRACRAFAAELYPSKMALIGASPVDRVVANFFQQVHRPRYPAEYFTSEPNALTWLSAHC